MLAIILFVAMITVNALANALPINNLNTGEVSDLYPSLFTPSGITFSIWSVIYFFLAGSLVVMWKHKTSDTIRKLLPLFCASCILNLSWILVWHYLLPGVSVIVMLLLLTVLIIIFKIVVDEGDLDTSKKVWIKFPFTIYLAWISVATIANISAYLISLGWRGGFLSEETWTVIMMCVATVLAFAVTSKFKTYGYAAVIIWALFGIFLKRRDTEYDFITYSAIVLVLILAASLTYIMSKRRGNA